MIQFLHDEGGATAIEYTLLASLAAVMAIVALVAFGNTTHAKYAAVQTAVSTAID